MKTTDKVRRMLAQGLTAPEIAKKLKIRPAYVHTVKWLDKKKAQPKKIKVTRKEILEEVLPGVSKLFGNKVEKKPKVYKSLDGRVAWTESKPKKLFVQPQHEYAAMKILADNDLVNHPPHYTKGGIDYWDFAEAKGLTENAYLFNAGKYIVRCGKKEGADPIQDLEKAIKFIQRDIDRRKQA